MNDHELMLDDVAAYALGTLGGADAARVRAHLRECETCRKEYQALASAAATIALSAEGPEPGKMLKARIMREVRSAEAPAPAAAQRTATPMWPAYLVAAACFAVAVALSLFNLSLLEQLHSAQSKLALSQERSSGLSHDLAAERSTVADLMDESARRLDVPNGQIVVVRDRVYITMHDMPQPPKGKVYQAWSLPKGSKTMVPAQTFVPDAQGVAVIALPVDAATTSAVAVSIEPDGGSKQPTTKPVVVQQLD